MDKLNMQTKDLANDKFEKFKELFPNAITETIDEDGNVIRAIDKDILAQEISTKVVEGREERYQFTWPDKRKAILAANSPSSKTLRPCREESVNFDETENLYIEGDNLEVLKLLQETYLGKIKMIYIDPPYNTGNDFVYKDNFSKNKSTYLDESGQYDEEGNRLEKNLESNGRFHTDWVNMIYPRLKLARNLLSDDGVIFISIDDSEINNLSKICDEVFHENNFIGKMIIDGTPKNDSLLVATSHEYILVYMKNINIAKEKQWGAIHPLNAKLNSLIKNKNYNEAEKIIDNFYVKNKLKGDNISNYKHVDEGGIFRLSPIDDPQSNGPKDERINLNTGKALKIPTRGWGCSKHTWDEWVGNNLILFPDSDDTLPSKKTYLTANKLEVMRSVVKLQGRKATSDLKNLFNGKLVFNNPKSVELISELIRNLNDKNAIVLDFFGGSSTTAEAVIRTNKLDNGQRRFILVQLEESLIDSEEKATGKIKKTLTNAIEYLNSINKKPFITEIGKERIRLVGKEIISEGYTMDNLDIGFRVLKTDTSNMKNVHYSPGETDQHLLDLLSDNIKEDRSSEDLLFQVMLDLGISLSSSIQKVKIDNKNVYVVADGFLIACFDQSLNDEIVKEIAKKEPYYAIFRDSAMASDSVATNFDQIFENISPKTIRKVL